MAQTLKLKRSAVSGNTPTTSDLALGEIAINTYDGNIFIKKNDGTESIVTFSAGGNAGSIEEDSFTGDGSTVAFTISTAPSTEENLLVFIDAAFQNRDSFTISGTTVTFDTAPDNTSSVRIYHVIPGTVDDGILTVAKFAASAIVTEGEGIASNDNDTTIPTSAAVKDYVDTQVATVDTLPEVLANGNTTGGTDISVSTGDDITFADSSKAIFGTDSDLELYHNGSNAFLTNTTGDLYIQDTNGSIRIRPKTGESGIDVLADGAVNLYYDNTSVLSTTADGISVTSEVEADEFIGDLRGAVLFKAQAGEDLTKGDIVYISGISGNTTVVSKAKADDASKMPAFGVASATASNNSSVTIYTFGTLSSIDTSSFSEGDELFVSTTAGAFTNSAPTGESSQIQKIAKVTRSDSSAGSIKIMGAGRSNAVPNLDEDQFFLGNASNQAVATDFSDAVEALSINNVVEDTTPQLGGDLASNGNDILFADNDKTIFGAGSDLQIYHDGSNSYIEDTGTGSLIVEGTNLVLRADDGSRYLQGVDGASGVTRLYHPVDDSIKLATTSTGIDVTGTATMDGLTVDGLAQISAQTNGAYALRVGDAAGASGSVAGIGKIGINPQGAGTFTYTGTEIRATENALGDYRARLSFHTRGSTSDVEPLERLRIDLTGDISFYEDTGTTAKFFWDASAEQLNIGDQHISQASITSGDSTTSGNIRSYFNDGAYVDLKGYGLEFNRATNYIRPTADGTMILNIGGNDASTDWNSIKFRSVNGLYMTGTQFLTTDRNLVNIGTISSGAITSSNININASGTSERYLQIGTGTTANHYAYIDLVGDATYTDYGFRIIRGNSGANTNTQIIHRGTGNFDIQATDSASIRIRTASQDALTINSSQNATFAGTISSGAITSTGEVEATALDINGNGDISGNLTLGGYLAGPATFTIDPAAVGDNTGTVVIAGNLQVDGTTTTINSTTLTVDDKNITLASGSANAAAANGAGLTVDCGSDTDATFTYDGTNDEWDFNKDINVTGTVTADGLTLGINEYIQMGGAGEFQIFNDGSNTVLRSSDNFLIQRNTSPRTSIKVTDSSGEVQLSYAGSPKLATTSTGIDVTGTATMDGLTVDPITSSPTAGGKTKIGDAGYLPYMTTYKWNGVGSNYYASQLINSGTYQSFKNSSAGTTIGSETLVERWRIASNGDISFYEDTGTTAKLFWDASAESLGIGTTSPTSKVDIRSPNGAVQSRGQLYLTNTDSAAINNGSQISLGGTYSGTSDTFFASIAGRKENSTAGNFQGYLQFATRQTSGNVERMRIDSSGNVGIGTSSPTGPLHVSGSASTVAIKIDNTGTGGDTWRIWSTNDVASDGGGKLGFYNEDTATRAMTLDSSGNVGIGTSSPASNYSRVLHLHNTSTGSALHLTDGTSGSGANDGTDLLHYGTDTYITNREATGNTRFYIGGTERMRIDSSGNVGIGTSSPNYVLNTNYNANATFSNAASDFTQMWQNSGTNALGVALADDSTARFVTNNGYEIAFNNASTEAMRIDSSGNVGIGTTSPTSFLTNATALEISGGTGVGSELILTNNSSMSANEVVGSLIFKNTDPSGTPNHFAGLRARAQSTFGRMDLEFYAGRSRMEGGTPDMVIISGADAQANVGIGTTSPTSKVHIEGSSDGTGAGADAMLHVKQNGTWDGNEPWALYVEGYSYLNGFRINAGDGIRGLYKTTSGGSLGFATSDTAPITFTQSTSAEKMRIHSNGFVGIGTTAPAAKLQVEEYGIDTTETSTTATTQVAIHTMSATAFRSARFTVQVTNSTDSTYHLTEILMIHDGTTPSITEYGTIFTGSAEATFDADISSGNVRLLATPASTDTMEFKVVAHSITT